jgi:endonuclease G, mitochondrial
MALKKGRRNSRDGDRAVQEGLREFIRAKGNDFLKDPNITSIGVGYKNGDGPISLQFTVGSKMGSALEMAAAGTQEIPKEIILAEGIVVPTDVLERKYKRAFQLVTEKEINPRRVRVDPIQPGISVSILDPAATAGTIGLIVFDRATGAPCILSNWHVLHGNHASVGDSIVQPGPYDDNNPSGNGAGTLLRSHLGNAGDCALARISGRQFDRSVFELNVTPRRMARVELGDKLIKSGRTTGVTRGVVRRVDVIAKIDYDLPAGTKPIGGFEIGVDLDFPPGNGEISQGGDSGAAWLVADGEGASDIFAGLHFAGETSSSSDEHALACYPQSVQQKLDFVMEPPARTRSGAKRTLRCLAPATIRTSLE